jgi:N-acetylglucosaminyldiphosphoundecaprenol N-acetyl-beta-D-mannosaminyltransferase
MVEPIDLAGLKINPFTRKQFFAELETLLKGGQQTFITTPYSEFLYHALRNPKLMALFNSANLAIADGVGVIWAQYYLSKPLTWTGKPARFVQAWAQMVYTGAQILLQPRKLYQTIPEKIVGADLIWDLSSWAQKNDHSIYLLGWEDQRTETVKAVLEKKFPGIKIVGYANTTPQGLSSRLKKAYTRIDLDSYRELPLDNEIIEPIKQTKPDILMVGYGYQKQEAWLAKHLRHLPVGIAIGLGGSFDYVIGKTSLPPKIIRSVGLEWLYRLFTQPARVKRIYQAFWGLIHEVIIYKLESFRKPL